MSSPTVSGPYDSVASRLVVGTSATASTLATAWSTPAPSSCADERIALTSTPRSFSVAIVLAISGHAGEDRIASRTGPAGSVSRSAFAHSSVPSRATFSAFAAT